MSAPNNRIKSDARKLAPLMRPVRADTLRASARTRRSPQRTSRSGGFESSIATELLQRHIQTLVDDHQQWQTLIADNILWELAYAPAIGPSGSNSR